MKAADAVVLAMVLVAVLVILGLFSAAPGITWDEPPTIQKGLVLWDSQTRASAGTAWLSELSAKTHPPLTFFAAGATTTVFDRFLGTLHAARLSSVAFAMMAAASIYLLALSASSRGIAALSVLCYFLLPRVFSHSLLATLDGPMAAMTIACAAVFVLTLKADRLYFLNGLVLGLAMLVKVNALLIPFVLWPWGLVFFGKRAVKPILFHVLVAPVLTVAGWPMLWRINPVGTLWRYLQLLRERDVVPSYYLGKVYADSYPPWHYPTVMALVTTPVALAAAFLLGIFEPTRRTEDGFQVKVLAFWGIAVLLVAASLPGVPRYDGVRLFLAVFPFAALLAGRGLGWLHRCLASRMKKGSLMPILAVAAVTTAAASGVLTTVPFSLSYYSEAIGGLPGAVKAGFEPTYWHDGCSATILDTIRQERFAGMKVAFFPAEFWTLKWYQGVVRDDQTVLRWERSEHDGSLEFFESDYTTEPTEPDLVVVNWRLSFTKRSDIDHLVADATVIADNRVWGEPITTLYRLTAP